MKATGNLPVLVGFLLCVTIFLAVALGWQVREFQRLKTTVESLESHYYASENEWDLTRKTALRALQAEQTASESRESLEAQFRKLTENNAISQLERVRKYKQLNDNFEAVAVRLKTLGIEWTPVRDRTLEESGLIKSR
jgi:hypothetical protein